MKVLIVEDDNNKAQQVKQAIIEGNGNRRLRDRSRRLRHRSRRLKSRNKR